MVFAIFAVSDQDALAQSIAATYPGKLLQVGPGQWLVADVGTSQQVSEKLRVSADPSVSSAIIVSFAGGYFGRQPTNVWEWVVTNWGG